MDTKVYMLALGIVLIGSITALTVNQEVIATVVPGLFTVYSPVEGEIYSDRMVLINVSMDSEADLRYSDNGGNFITICRDCDSYSKRKPFDDGAHLLTLQAIFENGFVNEYRTFTVDSKDPKIKKTLPKKGFANGYFEVDFEEANPTAVTLYYEQESKNIDLASCGVKKGLAFCVTSVDLSAYEGKEIQYWFEVKDIANRFDLSKKTKLMVDLTDPVVNNADSFFHYEEGTNKVFFHINITEENFGEVSYSYIDDKGKLRHGKICTKLEEGMCEKKLTFDDGSYELTIYVSDEAGNSISLPANFVVDED
jgi:hypothetical protein